MSTTLLSLALLCTAANPVETAKTPQTLLYVRTTPAGAEIRLDGKPLGTSDDLFRVEPGAYKIVLDLENYQPQEQQITIRDGRITRIELKLRKEPKTDARAAAAQPPADSVEAPQTPRILLYLVVGKERMTFQGKDTTWDELAKLLEKVPASKNTVLHIARAPDGMTAEHWDQAVGRAIKLIKRFGFGNLSQIGVHPLGFSGPTKHHSVCLVVGKDRMTFQGEDTTWEQLPGLLEKIADRKHTVLNFARAPGELTVRQWHQARSRAVGLAERFGFDHLSDIGEHPLGSKWEETRTLPEAEARSPTQALIWERVMNPPKGWTIEKSFIVPPDQTAAIGKKLGGPIKRLSNTIYSAHGQRVQVNVIECWTNADAEDIHKNVLAMKGDPAYALELGDTIVEFVGTFDVAFAKRAARELLQRQSDEPKEVSFGPVIERVVNDDRVEESFLIDLDTGRLHTRRANLHLLDEMHAWARKQGIDASGVKASEGVLAGFELHAAIVDDASWERVTPQAVRDALKQPDPRLLDRQGFEPHVVCLGGKGVPGDAVYAFKTREGGTGVLQLVGPGDKDHRSVKIRYRLVCPATTEEAARVDRLMRAYSEAVWTEALARLREGTPREAHQVIEGVANEAFARHLAPHRDMLAAHFLKRLPKVPPLDRSEWTGRSIEVPNGVSNGTLKGAFVLWHPVAAAGAYRQAVLARELGAETLGKRAMLQLYAPVGSVAVDSSLERPVIATALGDELLVVRLRRTPDGLYQGDQVERLRRKLTAAKKAARSYAALPRDASPGERLLSTYSAAAWTRLSPRLEAMSTEEITREVRSLAAEHLGAKRDLLMQEAATKLARLPRALPVNQSEWKSVFPDTGEAGAEAFRKQAAEELQKYADLPFAWDPLQIARHVRMAAVVQLKGAAGAGVRSMIAAAAMHPLETVGDASPDHPVIVTRTGNEVTIVRLHRDEKGTYQLDGFQWLARAADADQ